MKDKTQCELIIEYLRKNGTITNAEALEELGVGNIKGRIYDLRQRGYDIPKIWVNGVNRRGKKTKYAAYYLNEGKDVTKESI